MKSPRGIALIDHYRPKNSSAASRMAVKSVGMPVQVESANAVCRTYRSTPSMMWQPRFDASRVSHVPGELYVTSTTIPKEFAVAASKGRGALGRDVPNDVALISKL